MVLDQCEDVHWKTELIKREENDQNDSGMYKITVWYERKNSRLALKRVFFLRPVLLYRQENGRLCVGENLPTYIHHRCKSDNILNKMCNRIKISTHNFRGSTCTAPTAECTRILVVLD